MNTVLVTVVGPEGHVDAAVAADAPLEDLLPGLAQLAAPGRDQIPWELARPSDGTLSSERSLGDQGVADGCVLHLRPRGDNTSLAALRVPVRAPADGSTPVQRTRDALPEWLGVGRRLRAACRADATVGGERRRLPARLRAGWRASSYERRLDDAIRSPRLSRPVTIAVVSPSGGTGKSTIAMLLGMLYAGLREDRTVLLDTAPVVGFGPRHNVAVDDLLGLLEHGLAATRLDAYLVPANDGLTVLPAAPGAGPAAYERVIGRMGETAGILVVDCGAGLDDPAAQAAMVAADQIVVVVDAGPESGELVATTSAVLRDVAPPAVLVVNRIPERGQDVAWLEQEIPDARAMIAVHNDPRRAARLACGRLTCSERAGAWDEPLRELAAVLASEWVRLGLAARR